MPDNCHSYDEAIRPGQKAGDAVIGEDWEAQQTTSETGEVEIQFGTGTKKVKTTESAELIPHVPVEPLVWMIDHFSRNHKLGLVYEAKVGAGSLLVCQADLLSQNSPEANRFYDSLLAYAESEHFMPQAQIEEAWLEKVYQI